MDDDSEFDGLFSLLLEAIRMIPNNIGCELGQSGTWGSTNLLSSDTSALQLQQSAKMQMNAELHSSLLDVTYVGPKVT